MNPALSSPAPADLGAAVPTGAAEGERRLRVLHLFVAAREQNCYNQFCLGLDDRQEIALATFFPAELRVPPHLALFEGDGTVRGFLRALRAAFHERRYDVVHAHGPVDGFLFLAFRTLFRPARAATLYTAHHSFTNGNLRLHNRLLMAPIFALYDRVVCVGRASLESFPPLYRRLAGKRLSAIANGVDLARLRRSIEGMGTGGRTRGLQVVMVGRLIGIKDPHTVLEAFLRAALTHSRLRFVGEGELRGDLEATVERREAGDRVELAGLVPREDVYRLLSRSDLFVSASHGEGMPMAVLEAMACRCPVILSDIPVHREIADGADFIPLFTPGDADALAGEIRRFAGLSPERRAEIGRRCRSLVERRYALSDMHRRYEEVYVDALRS